MSTGPEHYREAEELLVLSRASGQTGEWQNTYALQAQVHAQLAEVAAFVEQVGLAIEPTPANHHGPAEPGNEWYHVIFGDQP
jgi:hypothetical protein